MIRTIEINGFKKFDHIQIENLAQVNLFVGMNNAGKTTLLEAVYGGACGDHFRPLFSKGIMSRSAQYSGQSMTPYRVADAVFHSFTRKTERDTYEFSFKIKTDENIINIQHTLVPGEIFSEFFYHLPDEEHTIDITPDDIHLPRIQMQTNDSISIQIDPQLIGSWKIAVNEKESVYQISFPYIPSEMKSKKPLFLARFTDMLTYRNEKENKMIYSQLSRENEIDAFVVEMNRSFEGLSIQKIENIPFPDGSEASISLFMKDGERIPLYAMGDGVRRWYDILGGMLSFPRAIHCLEEVDSGFHSEAQEQLSRNLLHYAEKYNNQLFMTTHNLEYMDALLQAAQKQGKQCLQEQIRIVTLRHDGQGVTHRVMDGEEALWARERGLELRI